jgi:hypothetical protein
LAASGGAPRKSGSHRTRRWSKGDSNSRSHSEDGVPMGCRARGSRFRTHSVRRVHLEGHRRIIRNTVTSITSGSARSRRRRPPHQDGYIILKHLWGARYLSRASTDRAIANPSERRAGSLGRDASFGASATPARVVGSSPVRRRPDAPAPEDRDIAPRLTRLGRGPSWVKA